MKTWLPLLVIAPLLASPASAFAGETFSSGPARVPLLELYTSEGCSSCPPAESWLSGLSGDAGLWTKFVPIALHVTYWDYLGWADVAGQKIFTERQRAYAGEWGSGTVYTPCFVRNGSEWRSSQGGVALENPDMTGTLQITSTGESTVEVVFAPAKPGESYSVTVALIGGGIRTKVQRGENAGRDLTHDFAVLAIKDSALLSEGKGKWTARVALPPKSVVQASRLGLVAWVETKGSIPPIQATGGYFKAAARN